MYAFYISAPEGEAKETEGPGDRREGGWEEKEEGGRVVLCKFSREDVEQAAADAEEEERKLREITAKAAKRHKTDVPATIARKTGVAVADELQEVKAEGASSRDDTGEERLEGLLEETLFQPW